MARTTITITAPNGAKVRTVHSKRYFVVAYGTTTTTYVKGQWTKHEPRTYAGVVKRTDSIDAARVCMNQKNNRAVYATYGDGSGKFLSWEDVENRAASERQDKKFAARVGNNGEARRLAY